ncbi:MAG: ChbG/HpnK family deacetylase, partial [Calditrichales bacterium]
MKLLKAGFTLLLAVIVSGMVACGDKTEQSMTSLEGKTWAEKLGYPTDSRIIIFHADDAGMCEEANIATIAYLEKNEIQSTAAMPPCEWFDEMVEWANAHPEKDVGLHLTLTSEWQTYRWGPVAPAAEVPGLVDADGYLWHSVMEVVVNGSAQEVDKEIRAQIDKALALGMKPDH